MRKHMFSLAAVIILSFVSSSAFSQSPQISSGLTWLSSAQTASGNWPQVETTDYYSTAAALDAVSALDPSSSAYTLGFQWLSGQLVSPTDYLSRQIIARTRAGQDASTELSNLLLYHNADGGWGGESGYLNDIIDTALALQALKAANYPDLSVNNTALAYLTNNQNPDGGWGFFSGDNSSVYMTAIVSSTLQQFPQTTTIATAITKATAYLLQSQNADGGYGFLQSTVYETALAYAALVGCNQVSDLPLQNALNYITSAQSANGSWNDDPYATALALKALYLSDHKPSPPPPAATTGSMMATIVDAATSAPLAGVSVQLTGDPSHSATSEATGMFALYGIPIGSQQITLSHAGYAPLTVTASITAGSFINLGKVGINIGTQCPRCLYEGLKNA